MFRTGHELKCVLTNKNDAWDSTLKDCCETIPGIQYVCKVKKYFGIMHFI